MVINDTQHRCLHATRLFCLICHKTKAFLISLFELVVSDHWSLIGVSRFFGNFFVEEVPVCPKPFGESFGVRRRLSEFLVLGKAQGTGQGAGAGGGCITTLPRGNAARCIRCMQTVKFDVIF